MKRHRDADIIPSQRIESVILLIRGERVILAADLARMYGVPVKRLNEQVQRNASRFPDDFVFQLSKAEAEALSRSQFVTMNGSEDSRSQIATLNRPSDLKSQNATSKRGTNIKYLPYAFTEHGVIMAANLLRSPQAIKVSVYVVRAFVKLREMLSAHKELAQKLAQLESKLQNHDEQIIALIDAIRGLMVQPEPPAKPPIGFVTEERARKPRTRSARNRSTAK
jgi:hypothetical protein